MTPGTGPPPAGHQLSDQPVSSAEISRVGHAERRQTLVRAHDRMPIRRAIPCSRGRSGDTSLPGQHPKGDLVPNLGQAAAGRLGSGERTVAAHVRYRRRAACDRSPRSRTGRRSCPRIPSPRGRVGGCAGHVVSRSDVSVRFRPARTRTCNRAVRSWSHFSSMLGVVATTQSGALSRIAARCSSSDWASAAVVSTSSSATSRGVWHLGGSASSTTGNDLSAGTLGPKVASGRI